MSYRPRSPAAERNRGPILTVLREVLRGDETVLEIGSGTGQHAVFFGEHLPGLTWLTSDLARNHAGIEAWLGSAGLPNVRAPRVLDVAATDWGLDGLDAVYSANTAHIMSLEQVAAMFAGVARCLPAGAPFLLYGPFNRAGSFTSESNRLFDECLRGENAGRGIRDLDQLREFGAEVGLRLEHEYEMPANNLLLLWRRASAAGE